MACTVGGRDGVEKLPTEMVMNNMERLVLIDQWAGSGEEGGESPAEMLISKKIIE